MPVRLQDGRVNAVASRDGGVDFLQGNGPARQIDIPILHPARAALLDVGLGILLADDLVEIALGFHRERLVTPLIQMAIPDLVAMLFPSFLPKPHSPVNSVAISHPLGVCSCQRNQEIHHALPIFFLFRLFPRRFRFGKAPHLRNGTVTGYIGGNQWTTTGR
jgi:hypothetical protein